MRKYFGTDGIRGTANIAPMTAETALKVGMAAGRHFRRGEHKHRVVIGKDTRLSGYMLESALTSGFLSMGMDVTLVGPMPTPGIAMLTRSLRADLGVMISASHNPFQDNGIKLFGPDGYKLSDAVEAIIEKNMEGDSGDDLAAPGKIGRAYRLEDVEGRYIEFAKNTFPKDLLLDGLKVVVDCANGAAYKVAPTVLWELEADVIKIGVDPNGTNINKGCGSTSIEALRQRVIDEQADVGIALDGDADRLILVDEKGQVIDGDQVMALIGCAMKEEGLLKGDTVVSTVMSNLGLERHFESCGVKLLRTQVGDRYVVEQMRKGGFNLGGEQSGHIVLGDHVTTGDGLIAALQVLAVLVRTGQPLSRVGRPFEPLPQLLKNHRYEGGAPLELDVVQQAIKDGEKRLEGVGRLLVRKSGTEPLVRVMAEGDNEDLISAVVDEIIGVMAAKAAE